MPAVDSPGCAATAAPAYHRGWIRSTGPTTTGIAAPTPAFLGCCHRFLSPSRRIQRNFQNAARIPLRTATACRTSGPRVSAAGRILALPFSGSLERGLLPFRAEDRNLFRGQLALGFVFPSSPGRVHQGSFSLHLCHVAPLRGRELADIAAGLDDVDTKLGGGAARSCRGELRQSDHIQRLGRDGPR